MKTVKINIMKLKRKNIAIAMIVLAMTGLGAFAYYLSSGEAVVVSDVASKDVFRLVEETGTVESESAVSLIAKASGTVAEILVEEGQSVKAGDLLLTFSDFSSASDVAGLKAQAEGVYAQYLAAKRLSDSNKLLYEQGAISYIDYTISLAATQQLSAQLASLGYSVESMIDATAATGIKAPIDGVVTVIYVKEGEAVAVGMPLAEVGGINDRIVSLHLISSDADLVSPGMKASVYTEGEFVTDQALVQKVALKATDYISLLGIVQKRVSVDIQLPEGTSLRLGSNADVEIIVAKRSKVLSVPSKSVFNIEEEDYVYVAQGRRAVLTKVEIGLEGEAYTEILNGLSQGQQVIVSPSTDIENGVRIKIKI